MCFATPRDSPMLHEEDSWRTQAWRTHAARKARLTGGRQARGYVGRISTVWPHVRFDRDRVEAVGCGWVFGTYPHPLRIVFWWAASPPRCWDRCELVTRPSPVRGSYRWREDTTLEDTAGVGTLVQTVPLRGRVTGV